MNTTEKAWRVLARKLMQANVRGPERDPRGVVAAALPWYAYLREQAARHGMAATPRQEWRNACHYARGETRALRQQAQ